MGRRGLRAEWRVQASPQATLAQAEFTSAEHVKTWGSPQSLLCGAHGGPSSEAVKVQIESIRQFVEARE